jgi:hypothetical protein
MKLHLYFISELFSHLVSLSYKALGESESVQYSMDKYVDEDLGRVGGLLC